MLDPWHLKAILTNFKVDDYKFLGGVGQSLTRVQLEKLLFDWKMVNVLWIL